MLIGQTHCEENVHAFGVAARKLPASCACALAASDLARKLPHAQICACGLI